MPGPPYKTKAQPRESPHSLVRLRFVLQSGSQLLGARLVGIASLFIRPNRPSIA
jgi:hypothetical protein